MKVNGSYTFDVPPEEVFNALLDPKILQATVPSCQAAWYSEEFGHTKVRIVTPVPGLEGPYDIMIEVVEQEAPSRLVLQIGRVGKIGGTIATLTQIHLQKEEHGGSLLTYETTADLKGPIAAANNPIFQGIAKQSLKTFFKRLNAKLAAA